MSDSLRRKQFHLLGAEIQHRQPAVVALMAFQQVILMSKVRRADILIQGLNNWSTKPDAIGNLML